MKKQLLEKRGSNIIFVLLCMLFSWSANGKEVLYLSNVDGDLELYVSDMESGKTRQLTNNELDDNEASWSPDGKWIVYTGRVKSDLEIFLVSSDGKKNKRLTHHEQGIDFSPQWSNDGKKIIYVSQTKNTYNLVDIDINTNKTTVLISESLEIKSPKWSPDNKYISFISTDGKKSHLNAINLETKKVTSLTAFDKEQHLDFNWAPDSQNIVFCARREKVIDLHSVNIKNGAEVRLTNLWTIDTEAAYSPDGEKMLFLSSRDNKVRRQLFVGDKLLKTVSAITPKNVEILNPTWSVDGKQVAYSSYANRRFVVVVKDLATGKDSLLNAADTGFQYSPKFKPNS